MLVMGHVDNQQDWHYVRVRHNSIRSFVETVKSHSPFDTFILRAPYLTDHRRGANSRAARKPCAPPSSESAAAVGHSSDISNDGAKPAASSSRLLIGEIVFIQGEAKAIQRFFIDYHIPYFLVYDCARRTPAAIPDRIMRTLRQVVDVAGGRLRFLPKPLAYYQRGHRLVRVTEGPLKGLEGYVLRITKDRKLVLGIGSLTIAIDGAHRERFEEVEASATLPESRDLRRLTYLQEEIDKNFFLPQTAADIQVFADNVCLLLSKALTFCTPESEVTATDMILFLLEEILYYIEPLRAARPALNLAPVAEAARNVMREIDELIAPADVRLSQREKALLAQRKEGFVCHGAYA